MRVMAEGRFNTPAQAAAALQAGAWAVTVGSALTRLEHATRWFCDALAGAAPPAASPR
jgi:N-acylglucosamine-6-phosphate 2-epimerase